MPSSPVSRAPWGFRRSSSSAFPCLQTAPASASRAITAGLSSISTDDGWVPVDTSEASLHPEKRDYFFGAVDPHRVLFTVGRDIRLEPPQAGDRLNYFIYPYVEVDGRPHARLTWTVHVQALDDGPPAQGNP